MPELRGGNNADVTTEDIFRILAGEITPDDIRERRRERIRRRKIGYMQNEIERQIEKEPTRVLLQGFEIVRLEGIRDDFRTDNDRDRHTAEWWAYKKVLARRSHVPNRMEARRLRQKQARIHRGQSKGKNR